VLLLHSSIVSVNLSKLGDCDSLILQQIFFQNKGIIVTMAVLSNSFAHIGTEFLSAAEGVGVVSYVGTDETLDELVKSLVL
jgi:hypothetical protein